MSPPLLLLAGATATGKSALALALAERLPVEIVSADSAQVYRGMDIGTAKPDAATRAAVPHHLIDVADPAEVYSAARFAEDARAAIAAIRSRGRIPVVVGGTLLYLKALLGGLSALPSADPAVRARLAAACAERGRAAMHAELARRDPVTAARLHPNDWQRVQRALELIALTGRPASALQVGGEGCELGPVLRFATHAPPRPVLHARIERRFDQMLDAGLLDEVAALVRRGDLHPELPALRSVGYRQLWPVVTGRRGLSEGRLAAIAATRRLAKRQLTWLRGEAGWHTLPEDPEAAVAVLLAALRGAEPT